MNILQKMKNYYSGLKLRNKILFPSAIVFLVTFLFFILFIIQDERISGRDYLNKKAENMTEYVISAVIEDLWHYDYDHLINSVNSFIKDREITRISFVDSENETIFQKQLSIKGKNDINKKIKLEKNDILIGILEITFTDFYIEKDIRNIVLKFIILALSIFFILFVFILFASNLSLQPLELLMLGAQSVKGRNYDFFINNTSTDELGKLAGTFNSMIQSIQDYSREVEEQRNAIVQLKNYLSNIINSMPSILISLDHNSKITHWNEAAENFTGIKGSAALGKEIRDLYTDFQNYSNYCRQIIEKKEPMEFRRVKLLNHKNKFYNIFLYPLITNDNAGMVMRIDDITELEVIEEQLKQAQKMKTIGTLAGGLAHDFNNVLGGITGSLSIINYKIDKGQVQKVDQLQKHLNTIEESANRAIEMVEQLLTLSRKKELSIKPCDLNVIVEHIKKICRNTFDKSIELNIIKSETAPIVNADSSQLEQILLNLCVNASHALTFMRKKNDRWGGEITISIEKIYADKVFVKTHPEATMQYYWILSVKDDGVGMDSNTISKIFEPFFTTKEKGRGTGLGLSMVYNIIKLHNGFIDVYSEQGIGTSFNVYLPMSESAQTVQDAQHEPLLLYKGEGVVLVVDDEEVMRKMASVILKECGYEVILANNGQEAVQIFKTEHKKIRVVLLDMVMPKMSGKETYLELKKIDPTIKVLLTSGFKKDERVQAILNQGVIDFLQKPYTIDKLSKKMHEVINTKTE